MKKILLIHPEGNVNNNPNLTGIVEILCENGYKVEIVSPHRPEISQKRPCPGSSINLIDVPNFSQAYYFPFVIPTALYGQPESLNSYIRQTFGVMDLVIGIDRGIIEASFIAQTLNIPFGLISYEICFVEETGSEFKEPEIAACQGVSFAVCQDKVRSLQLSRENNIRPDLFIEIPVAGRGFRPASQRAFRIHDSLKFSHSTKIALYMGSIADPWSMIDDLLKTIPDWPSEWILLLHHRYGNREFQPIVHRYPSIFNSGKVFISPFQQLDFEELPQILHDVDLGLALYTPLKNNISAGNNLKYLGMASGKIATYLQHGLPILVNEIGIWSDTVINFDIGVVIQSASDIPVFLRNLSAKHFEKYRGNIRKFFDSGFDLNLTIQPLLQRLSELLQSKHATAAGSVTNPDTNLPSENKKKLSGNLIADEIKRISDLMNQNMLEDANKALKQAIEQYPDSPDFLNLQAVLKLRMGDKEGSKSLFLDLVRRWPTYITAYNNLACIYWDGGDVENASHYYEDAVRLSQYDKAIVLGYGEMLFSFKKYAKCKEVYEGYLRINPNDAEVWSLLKRSTDILEKLAKFINIAGKKT
jgi:tetratricopeptide (TPR) repeat protein